MTQERLRRRLGRAVEPVLPDPDFARELYLVLSAELGFSDAAAAPTRRLQRRSRALPWREMLLVAVLAVGLGALASNVGGFAVRLPDGVPADRPSGEPPNACELVTTAEIGAIEGSTRVWLADPGSAAADATSVTVSCEFGYVAPPPDGTRRVGLRLSRYSDRETAAAWIGEVSKPHGPVSGVGDAAAIYFPTAAYSSLFVLQGSYILELYGDRLGTYLDLGRLKEIALLILGRL